MSLQPTSIVPEEVIGHLVVGTLVVRDGSGDGVVEIGALHELLRGVDLGLLNEVLIRKQCPEVRLEEETFCSWVKSSLPKRSLRLSSTASKATIFGSLLAP